MFLAIYRFVLLGPAAPWALPVLFSLGAAHGATFGGRPPLLNVTWGNFFGRRSLGGIMGFSTPFALTANAVGPVFAAYFFDVYGSYAFPFYVFVLCFGLTGILCLSMKPPVNNKKNPLTPLW
jgi:MFS family permease